MTRGILLAAAMVWLSLAPSAQAQRHTVAKAKCGPDDKVETGLQGQVPVADRHSGAAAPGYWCNLKEIGAVGSLAADRTHAKLTGWANFDTYKHCAYFHDGNDGNNGGGGTIVVDVSDPTKPKQSAYLTSGAMQGAWESLRVNQRRGLLVADHQSSSLSNADVPGKSPFDVYDVSQDCTKPRLLFSGPLPNGLGHEGWFQPDGMVYYVSGTAVLTAVDLSDPAHPKELGVIEDVTAHGGSVSDDGRRGYFCTNTSVTIYDTSQVAERKQKPKVTQISEVDLPGTQACQETYPLTYGGKEYLIQFGELGEFSALGGSPCGSIEYSSFSRPNVIDISNEREPKLVATLMNEVALPENCPRIAADWAPESNPNAGPVSTIFLYGTHMCHPDRLHDPTLLACAEFFSGVRVYDIRDPLHAKEIAYYNAGTAAPGDPTLDQAASRPVIRPDLGQIWYDGLTEGFHVLQFTPGVYPFPESNRCPTRRDWFVEQYNPGLDCRPAPTVAPTTCRTTLRTTARSILGARRMRGVRSATVYVNGKRVRALRGRGLRRAVTLTGLKTAKVRVRVSARRRDGKAVSRTRVFDVCR